MKRMKKAGIAIAVLCVVAILAVGVVLSIPPKMVDFRGEVTEVTVEGETYTFRIVHGTAASYVVMADARTKVYRESDRSQLLSPKSIQVGDTIEGNYRLFADENQAKFIRIWG